MINFFLSRLCVWTLCKTVRLFQIWSGIKLPLLWLGQIIYNYQNLIWLLSNNLKNLKRARTENQTAQNRGSYKKYKRRNRLHKNIHKHEDSSWKGKVNVSSLWLEIIWLQKLGCYCKQNRYLIKCWKGCQKQNRNHGFKTVKRFQSLQSNQISLKQNLIKSTIEKSF